MEIFETAYSENLCMDDTVTLCCSFLHTRIIDGHTEYVIRVHRGSDGVHCWTIIKRYREFVALHKELQAGSYNIQLPPKKFIGNLNRQFIAERQTQLQKYIDQILNNLVLSSAYCVKKFLDPDHYSEPFYQKAFQDASMALRDKPDFYDLKKLAPIGWRLKKLYGNLQRKREYVHEFMLSWMQYGPDKCLDIREIQSCLKSLIQLQHPYIMPIVSGSCYNNGVLIIRTKCEKGSLRDLIYEQHPEESFLKKYRYQKERIVLPSNAVTTISIQILHALKFLHEKKIPYGNLHSGNVFIEDNVAKISDVENGVLGLPSFYRPYLVNFRKVRTLEDADVYCFGHLLYEMTFGEQLENNSCKEIPFDCYNHIRPILELILLDSCKEKLPNVGQLLEHDSFNACSTTIIYKTKPYCKINSHVKEYFHRSKVKIEKRLNDHQHALRIQKRLSVMQEIVDAESNENNDINHRKTKKKNSKVKKTSSQMSLGTSSVCESVSSIVSSPTFNSLDTPTSPPISPENFDGQKSIIHGAELSSTSGSNILKSSSSVSCNPNNRTALLESITSFNKNCLKKRNCS